MNNTLELIAYVRFQIEQLSIKNAHHDFEHICRHLTRLRICSNIIPSTGPVSSGGDSGIDFQSFRTYLEDNGIQNSVFIGLFENKKIAFSCSLKKDGIKSKIKDDIEKIVKSELEFSSVFYFSGIDISIAINNELCKFAKKQYKIELTIIDANAISEFLVDNDTFWIAKEYLKIPEEMFPNLPDDTHYNNLYIKFKDFNSDYLSYQAFCEIKQAIREATFNEKYKSTLTFWIELLEKYTSSDYELILRRKCIYEVAVARLRGIGTLIGFEDNIREYFSTMKEFIDISDIEDSSVLLKYCFGALKGEKINIDYSLLKQWESKLIQNIIKEIDETESITRKCYLFEIYGYCLLTPDTKGNIDIPKVMKIWLEMIDLAENAPLFSLERFSNRITTFIPLIGNNPDFDILINKADHLLHKRYGDFKVAEKTKDRAFEYFKQGDMHKAIKHFHLAKLKWFSEETLEISIKTMILLSRCYLKLNLLFAAKYYSFAAAYISFISSDEEIKKNVPKALFLSTKIDYVLGAWVSFFDTLDIALMSHKLYSSNPLNIEEHKEYKYSLVYFVKILSVSKKYFSEVFNKLQLILEENKHKELWEDIFDEFLDVEDKNWENITIDKMLGLISEETNNIPMNDIGKKRKVIFNALGIEWEVNWKNKYDDNSVGEQFVSILQIILFDLAIHDLYLLSIKIKINIEINDIEKPSIEEVEGENFNEWKIIFPKNIGEERNDMETLIIHIIALVQYMLFEVSLMLEDKFKKELESQFKDELLSKVLVAQPYQFIYKELIPKEIYDNKQRDNYNSDIQYNYIPQCNNDLKWKNDIINSYNEEKIKEIIKNRYRNAIIPIKETIKHLNQEEKFQELIKNLRNEGWKDWHILTTLSSLIINYRVNKYFEGKEYDSSQVKTKFMEYATTPETIDTEIVPISVLSLENFKKNFHINLVSSLNSYGLEIHIRKYDPILLESIERFLACRCNFFKDDIEHEIIFNF